MISKAPRPDEDLVQVQICFASRFDLVKLLSRSIMENSDDASN
jgi:hypothetical protein